MLYKRLLKLIIASVILFNAINIETLADMPADDILKNADFKEYSCYRIPLRFDTESMLPSYWCADGGVLEYVQNDPEKPAYSGSGAVYADTRNGFVSMWGGPYSGGRPQIGDTVSGYFYYKKLSEPEINFELPKIRLYSTAEGDSENADFCVTENFNAESVSNAPLNEWIRVEIPSTGKIVTAENKDSIEYSITMGQDGHRFMIDNIVFGGCSSESTEYDILKHLTFDIGFLPDTWAGEGASVEFKIDDPDYPPHSGNGALYINSTGENAFYSVWDGHYGFADIWPRDNDIVRGYFYIKKLRETDNPLPNVRIYNGENIPENYYCAVNLNDKKMSDLPLNEWTRVELLSTGKPMAGASTLQFNLTSDYTGDEYMIDDITLECIDMSYTLSDKWSSCIGSAQEEAEGETITIHDKKAYIIGGKSGSGQNSVKIYDLENNEWTSGAPMPLPVYNHTSILCKEKIYVFGGYNVSASQICNAIQIYDINTNTWMSGGIMLRNAANQAAVLCGNKIYLSGTDGMAEDGLSFMARSIYDNSWHYEIAQMPVPVNGHNAQLKDFKIYITGGEHDGEPVGNVQIYNIITNEWQNKTPMPQPVTGHKVIYNRGKLYIIGGKTSGGTNSDKIQIYDTAADSWSAAADIPSDAAVENAVHFNGKIYLFCPGEKVHIYDMYSDSWTESESLNQSGPIPAFVYRDCIWFAGASGVSVYGDLNKPDSDGTVLSQNELFVQDSNNGVCVYVEAKTDNYSDKVFSFTYPADKFILKDTCVFTPRQDLKAAAINEAGISILQISDGKIKFTVNRETPAGLWASGIVNGLKFERIADGDASFKCIMSEI